MYIKTYDTKRVSLREVKNKWTEHIQSHAKKLTLTVVKDAQKQNAEQNTILHLKSRQSSKCQIQWHQMAGKTRKGFVKKIHGNF
jgi:hypothetical protein